jgi:hypothetical protein
MAEVDFRESLSEFVNVSHFRVVTLDLTIATEDVDSLVFVRIVLWKDRGVATHNVQYNVFIGVCFSAAVNCTSQVDVPHSASIHQNKVLIGPLLVREHERN